MNTHPTSALKIFIWYKSLQRKNKMHWLKIADTEITECDNFFVDMLINHISLQSQWFQSKGFISLDFPMSNWKSRKLTTISFNRVIVPIPLLTLSITTPNWTFYNTIQAYYHSVPLCMSNTICFSLKTNLYWYVYSDAIFDQGIIGNIL